MYGVTRAPFNSNRSSCGIEVVVPLFSHPKFETPSKVFRSNAQTTAMAERGADHPMPNLLDHKVRRTHREVKWDSAKEAADAVQEPKLSAIIRHLARRSAE